MAQGYCITYADVNSALAAAWIAGGGFAIAAGAGGRPALVIDFSMENPGGGIEVPSGGDGIHRPVLVEGTPARRVEGEGALYLYARIRHEAWTHGPADAWVVVEALDDHVARVRVQYDAASSEAGAFAAYADSPSTGWLTGGGGWRRLVFALPSLALKGRQNHGADFRLCGSGLTVRKIEVHSALPADVATDWESIPDRLRVTRPPGMKLTFGNDATAMDAPVFAAMSVSSIESYVDWAGVEPEPGRWDWSKWDAQVDILERAGLKWVPFLIAGPAYATPMWFQNSPDSLVYRCLEHNQDSRVQSLFNPALRPRVDRFLEAFARRYRDRGVIESVLLGITGIYGESIYPAGPEGGWTTRLTGDYHNHAGWWAGDPAAAESFRDAMRTQYGSIGALSTAWAASLGSFDDVVPFLPGRASNDRARSDFAEWYQHAMTEWSVFWVAATRRHFPDTPIYLCTGGAGDPVLGADFTAQAAAIAPFGAGIRITNESSDYARNFTLTREVATATRLYGTFCGFEPASRVDATGVVARIYNAAASGARQLHFYTANVLDGNPESLENFAQWASMMIPRKPQVDAAVYASRESWALDPAANGRFRAVACAVRDAADFDVLTRLSVADGGLKERSVLLIAESPVLDPAAADHVETWVREGGTLVVAERTEEAVGGRLHDLSAWREALLPAPVDPSTLVKPTLDGPAPARWALDIGSPGDEVWLDGDWHDPEQRASGTCRWTGARAKVRLPVNLGEARRLRLNFSAPHAALGREGIQVRVNDTVVAVVTNPGAAEVAVEVDAASMPDGLAMLELRCSAWRPLDVMKTDDPRHLGVEVSRIEWLVPETTCASPGKASILWRADPIALARVGRKVGRGRTILLASNAPGPEALALILAGLMPDAPDGRLDGRYATRLTDGVLWFDPSGPEIREASHR